MYGIKVGSNFKLSELPCVSRIVALIVKNIDTKNLFAYLVGWLDFSTVEIKKK